MESLLIASIYIIQALNSTNTRLHNNLKTMQNIVNPLHININLSGSYDGKWGKYSLTILHEQIKI